MQVKNYLEPRRVNIATSKRSLILPILPANIISASAQMKIEFNGFYNGTVKESEDKTEPPSLGWQRKTPARLDDGASVL